MKSVFASKSLVRRCVDIMLYVQQNSREFAVAPMKMELDEVKSDGSVAAPSLTLTFDMAQELFQELWDLGYRPNDGEGSSGQVEALKRHVSFAETVVLRLLSKSI